MKYPSQWLCEQVGDVGVIGDMNDVDNSLVNTIANEVVSNGYMFHFRVTVRIVGTAHSTLIVAE